MATHTLPAHNNSDTYDQYTFTDDISSIGTQAVTITFRLYGYNQPAGADQLTGAGTSNATGSACSGSFANNWSGTGSNIILDATVSASSAPAAIPTLSEWGMMTFVGVLGGYAAWKMRRR